MAVPDGTGRNNELKRRLALWEQGHFDELVGLERGQQSEMESRGANRRRIAGDDSDEVAG